MSNHIRGERFLLLNTHGEVGYAVWYLDVPEKYWAENPSSWSLSSSDDDRNWDLPVSCTASVPSGGGYRGRKTWMWIPERYFTPITNLLGPIAL